MPLVGDLAPDFALRDQDKEPVTLSNLRGGPVMLVFFPGAFSSTCTRELCEIRDDFRIYDTYLKVLPVPRSAQLAREWSIEELMKADLTDRLGAEPHERPPEHLGQRNGHRRPGRFRDRPPMGQPTP